MTAARYCDGPGCDTWTTAPERHGFLHVYPDALDFCSWDCAMRYAATREPLTVVEA